MLLEPGRRHRIRCVRSARVIEGPTCGLIPLGSRADMVTTQGLEWNLQAESLEMGVRVSTSNSIMDINAAGGVEGSSSNGRDGNNGCRHEDGGETYGEVIVETSHPLLWTCEAHFETLP